MPAFYRAPLLEFISASDSQLTGLLSLAYARDGFKDQKSQQTLAWAQDIFRLRESLASLVARTPAASHWTVLLEFNIPRKMRRIDVVLLAGDQIILLEQKTHTATADDCLQVEELRPPPPLLSPTLGQTKDHPRRRLAIRFYSRTHTPERATLPGNSRILDLAGRTHTLARSLQLSSILRSSITRSNRSRSVGGRRVPPRAGDHRGSPVAPIRS